MNRKNKILTAILVMAVLSFGIVAFHAMNTEDKALATAPDTADPDQKLVSVQGEGVIPVTPDIAYVTLGVETNNKDVNAAQTENKEKMNAIMGELKNLGIPDKDIQTSNYSVYPDYQWKDDVRTLNGYRVTNLIRVKLTKLDEIGKVLDAVTAKGANSINGVELTVDDSKKAYEDAMKQALKDAEDKAKAMVKQFGYTKVTPVTIIEGSQSSVLRGDYVQNGYKMAVAEAADGGTSVSPGEMEIRAQVNVSFEFSK
jgi:hypothetical protein